MQILNSKVNFIRLFLTVTSLITLNFMTTSCVRDNSEMVPPSTTAVVDETYVHKYGVAVPSDFWTKSGENGAVITAMGDGTVITRTYNAGLLDGETSYSYPHSSQTQKIEMYNNGTLLSVTEYYFSGSRQNETKFDSPVGMKTVSTWYLSGTPRSIEIYNGELLSSGEYFNINNNLDSSVDGSEGTRLVRDDYGQLISTDSIKKGLLALRTTYHTNNSPKEMIPYKNGVVDGSKQSFLPAGEPDTIEQWSDGQQHGTTTIYQHGEKFAEVPYNNGVKNGMEQRYRNGQEVVKEVSWQNGQLHGPSTTYVGDTATTDWYYKGSPTTKNDYDFMVTRPVVR